jgi:ribosomal protein S18 acetylase RimI-like enzyme
MVLVDPTHRRKGIGLSLLEQALEIVKDVESIKLDATPAGRQVYVKLGLKDEYGLSRMRVSSWNAQNLVSSEAAPLTSEDLDVVGLIDQRVFGADRMALLRWMLDGAPELAFKVVSADGLVGYCFGRPGYNYTHIGPIVVANADVAIELASAALRNCGDKLVILDVPHGDEAWRGWLGQVGFTELRPFVRMYKGKNLDRGSGISWSQYAILGPEFG